MVGVTRGQNISLLYGGGIRRGEVVGDDPHVHDGGKDQGLALDLVDLVHGEVGKVDGGEAAPADEAVIALGGRPIPTHEVPERLHFEVEAVALLGVDLHDGQLGGHSRGQSAGGHPQAAVHTRQDVGQVLGIEGQAVTRVTPIGREGLPLGRQGIPLLGEGGHLHVGEGLQRGRQGRPLPAALPVGEGDLGLGREGGVGVAGGVGIPCEVPGIQGIQKITEIEGSLGVGRLEIGILLGRGGRGQDLAAHNGYRENQRQRQGGRHNGDT